MTKSEYSGECQICGKTQKLQGDLLSLHGYKLSFGFFEGTCPGAKELPYEKDCSLIAEYIPYIKVRISKQELRIENLWGRKGSTGFFNIFDRTTYKYKWEEVEFFEGSFFHGGKIHRNTGFKGKSDEENARHYDAIYIKKVLVPALNESRNYLHWCNYRVSNWKEKELIKNE